MTAVAETYLAAVPWAQTREASPLADVARGHRDARGLALMGPRTFRLACDNLNPRDVFGRRTTSVGCGPASLAELFRGDGLPVPCVDHNAPEGRVVLVQDGLPDLTIDVGC